MGLHLQTVDSTFKIKQRYLGGFHDTQEITDELSTEAVQRVLNSDLIHAHIADLVLRIITPIDSDSIRLLNLRKSKDSIVDVLPGKALELNRIWN